LMIRLKPIGVVRVELSDDEVRKAWFTGGVEGIVEVYPEYAEGLRGIDGFSHLILITWLHKADDEGKRRVLVVKPRRFMMLGFKPEELPVMGVFACDSPHRPNPIGLSIVRLLGREGRILRVAGLDLFDGTPVLDIKAYTPDRAVDNVVVPEWYREFERKVEEKLGRKITI